MTAAALTPGAERQADVIVVGAGPGGRRARRTTSPTPASTCCCWRSPRSPATRSAATGSPRARSSSWSAWASTSTQPGLAEEQGPAHRRRRAPPRAALARPRQLPAVRPGPHPDGPRRDPRPARREGRRPADGAHGGHRPGPRRAHRPRRRRHRQAGRRPRPQGRRRGRPTARRSWSPPTASRARLAIALGLERRENRPMGVAVRAYYETPRHDDDVDGVLARALGRQARREQPAARLRLDLRGRRRHRQRRPRHPQHLARPSSTSTTRTSLQALAREHARGVGLPRREPRRPDRLGRAADGLQPQAALHPRRAAGRRLRRHGQPVQRRGHRLRPGGRPDGRRHDRCRRWPGPRARRASGCSRATPRRSTRRTAATSRSAGSSRR